MARKVSRDDLEKWLELRGKGYTFKRIGSELGWDSETVRVHIAREEARRREQAVKKDEEKGQEQFAREIESEAFAKFEEGENPVDLVREKICSADIAERLMEKYTKLKNMSRPELEILEARMENASHVVRCALGKAEVEINCPICHKWGKMVLAEINGVNRWVCSSCGEIPF